MRTFRGKKDERPGGSTGHQGSVERAHTRRPTPDTITLSGVGSRDAPHVLIDPGIFLSLNEAPKLVGPGGGNGIGEVVGVPVTLVAVVAPGLRILVNEERRSPADVVDSAIRHNWPLDRIPRFRRNRVGG